ncbi:MAG TPA: alpha/beta hydrolase [Thermoanaerobaculia bacterium]|nr:alpha/beta hydrolase [Thermoanaerobaculia bacterium]
MTSRSPLRLSDLRGVSRLALDASVGVTDLVEAMHHNISQAPSLLGTPAPGATRGITGLVYRSIRGVTRLVGGGIDAVLARILPLLGEESSSPGREALLAALNGVLGDHLAASGNPLAISMRLRPEEAVPPTTGKLIVLAHGLCMNDLQWHRDGHDHGAELARDLGFTPLYLHYNSGLHISTNGRALADLLETLVRQWPVPVEELAILGHSMGGLVARGACHYGSAAGHDWPRHLKKLIFLGTPHHGSPLERGGNWIDFALGVSPYTAPLARLGKIRSAGITDLRHGSLLDEDWEGRDRFERSKGSNRRLLPLPLPLPDDVECYAMAATKGRTAGGLGSPLPSDGFVPLDSALGRHEDPGLSLSLPESRCWILHGAHHFDLLSHPEAYGKIRQWLAAPGLGGSPR